MFWMELLDLNAANIIFETQMIGSHIDQIPVETGIDGFRILLVKCVCKGMLTPEAAEDLYLDYEDLFPEEDDEQDF